MLQALAEFAALNYKNPTNKDVEVSTYSVAIDPATVTLMADAIVAIVQLWKSCKKTPEQAAKDANQQFDLYQETSQRKAVENVVRKQLWFWQWWSYGQRVVDALLYTGKSLTPEQIVQLYEEVQENAKRK